MKTQVTTQPVAINAGTSGVATVLYNEGPDTLYVDKDGTVSASLSMAVPPLTYIPWPASGVLWAVSRGLSNVRQVNTSMAPTLNATPSSVTLSKVSAFPSSDTAFVHDMVETAQYQSVRISFTQSASIDVTKMYYVYLDWYDSDQTYLSTRLYQPGMAFTGKPVILTAPVEGSFLRTRVLAQATGDLTSFILTGYTASRPTSLTPNWDTGASTLTDAASVYGANITLMRTGIDFAVYSYGVLEDVAFHSVSQHVAFSFNFGVAPGAVSFAIRILDGLAITSNKTTAAAPVRQDFEFYVPVGIQLHLHWFAAPAGLPITTLTWRNV